MAMAAQPLKRLPLACCKIYISDTRNLVALQEIESTFRAHPKAPLLHVFEDHEYNRVGYTLAGPLSTSEPRTVKTQLQSAVTDVVWTALRTIDLRQHSGSHPRLGVVDHICMHPLGTASMADTAAFAQEIASEIGESLKVPAFLYGAAHRSGRPLDDIRRALGYFQPNNGGLWIGSNVFPTGIATGFWTESCTAWQWDRRCWSVPLGDELQRTVSVDRLEQGKTHCKKSERARWWFGQSAGYGLTPWRRLHGDCLQLAGHGSLESGCGATLSCNPCGEGGDSSLRWISYGSFKGRYLPISLGEG